MKLLEAVGPFIDYCRSERQNASSTIAKYRECLRVWVLPWLGVRDVAGLNLQEIFRLRQAMDQAGLSVARQYSVLMCLKGLLKFCRTTLGLTTLDPDAIKLPRRPAPSVEYLQNEEVQLLLDAINVRTFAGIRLRALIELLLATGVRISEALSFTREPFDSDQTDFNVIGKGSRKRPVFFSPRCRFWAKEYLARRVDDHPALFVTTGVPTRPCRREDIHRFFKNLRNATGLKKRLSPHILRHTFCTNLRNNGADISLIKDLAGHQNIQTTARYYLGKDKAVLRDVVDRCLDYGVRPVENHLLT